MFLLCEKVNFGMRQLLLQATDNRAGQNDIADGTESYNKYLGAQSKK